MREFFARHRSVILAFMGLTLPLFLLYVHGRHPRKTTVVEVALTRITAPVQGAAAHVLSGISDVWNGYVALIDAEDDNERLRDEVADLTARAERAKVLEEENARLRQLLEFKRARRELVTVGAHVIGKDVSPYGRVLRVAIDVGDQAVAEDMAVVDYRGLVGRILRVAGDYAEVLLAVDARSNVAVRVQGKGVTGTVTGTSAASSYMARLSYLHDAEPLAVGDVLVTSGHDKVFPPGIRVGTIHSVQERQRGLEYELEVTPSVNFSDVEVVSVITAVVEVDEDGVPIVAPSPDPDAGGSAP